MFCHETLRNASSESLHMPDNAVNSDNMTNGPVYGQNMENAFFMFLV